MTDDTTEKLWYSPQSRKNRYHTERCYAVEYASDVRSTTDIHEIEQLVSEYTLCSICSGEMTEYDGGSSGLHEEIRAMDPDSVEI